MNIRQLPLSERLRELRLHMGPTQKEIALELKRRFDITVRQNHLSSLETGAKAPSLPLLVALAQVLETSTDYLLGLTENPLSVKEIEAEARAGGAEGKFSHLLARLPTEMQKELLSVAEAYLHRNIMLLLLNEIEEIGGEAALSNVMDRLESSLSETTRRFSGRGSDQP